MRHRVQKIKLGRDKEHTTSIMRNLAISLLINEKMETTEKKAKAVASFIDRLITIGKKKDAMNAIRQLEKLLQHPNSAKKILEELVKRYEGRTSGFTSLHKVGYRKGDNAEVVQIQLV